jgi:DNA-directed RNA polymerase subunit K/omega
MSRKENLEEKPIDSDIESIDTSDDEESILPNEEDENDDDDEDAEAEDDDDDDVDQELIGKDELDDIQMMMDGNDDISSQGDDNDEQEESEEEDDDDDTMYQKIENYVVGANLEKEHPEIQNVNFEEIASLSRVVRDKSGIIIDPLHTTVPFLTKYERARIIGTRAEQLESGAHPFVEVEPHVINARTIAMMEFEQKKIPFIIARPLPNKAIEYWRLEDLEYV